MPLRFTPLLLALALPTSSFSAPRAVELTTPQFLTPTYREKFFPEWMALLETEQALGRAEEALALVDWLKPALPKAETFDRMNFLLTESRACTYLRQRDSKLTRDCEAPLEAAWKEVSRPGIRDPFYFQQDITVEGVRAARDEASLQRWLKRGEALKAPNPKMRDGLLSMLFIARGDWHHYRSYPDSAWSRQVAGDGRSEAWLKHQQSQNPGLRRLDRPVKAGPIELHTNAELRIILVRLGWKADQTANESYVLDAEFLLDSLAPAAELADGVDRGEFFERRFSVAQTWGTRKQARAVVDQWLKIPNLSAASRMSALLSLAEVSNDLSERERSLLEAVEAQNDFNPEERKWPGGQLLLRARVMLTELYGEQARFGDLLSQAELAFSLAKAQDTEFWRMHEKPQNVVPPSAHELARVRGLAAWAYLGQGKFQEAEAVLREALPYVGSVSQGASLVYFGLAAVERANGRGEVASTYLRSGETKTVRSPASMDTDVDRRFASAVRRYLKSGNAADLKWDGI